MRIASWVLLSWVMLTRAFKRTSFLFHRGNRATFSIQSRSWGDVDPLRMMGATIGGKFVNLGRMYMSSSTGDKSGGLEVDNDASEDGEKKTKPKKQKSVPISALTEGMAKIELIELNKEINYHDVLYYSKLEEEISVAKVREEDEARDMAISDRAYDKLVSRADAISGRFGNLRGFVDKFNRVGYSRSSKFDPFSHLGGNMLSLDNAFSEEQIRSFVDRCITKLGVEKEEGVLPFDIVVEPKIDGLSLALHYVDGELVGAGTRGDGIVGENVTANVQYVNDIPKTLPRRISIEVRGEVYITKDDFSMLNRERLSRNETKFSTTRNAAAGGLRQIDPRLTAGRKLRFFAYSLFGIERSANERGDGLTSVNTNDQSQTLDELQRLGFGVAAPTKVCTSLDEAIDHCMHLENVRRDMQYDIDGAVMKVDSLESQGRIGELSRFPGWAMAYKFKAEEGVTVLKAIEVQVGRTGVLTPVAVLEPVEIGGVIIERATLHNEAEVRRHNLSPGAMVTVIRAGDVIPKVVGRANIQESGLEPSSGGTDGETPYSLPTACPVCGSPTEKDGDILVRCTGTTVCSAQAVSQISHFCSRDAADIDGLGPARIEELHQLGMLRNIADIYSLRKLDLEGSSDAQSNNTERMSLRELKGWGDRSVNNLLAAIDDRQSLAFDRFLFGLGIRHIGLGSARDIAKEFGDFDVFWEYIKKIADMESAATEEVETGEGKAQEREKKKESDERCSRLYGIPGIGPKIIISLIDYASTSTTRALVDSLLLDVKVLPSATAAAPRSILEGSLANETFLFTGKLERLTRAEAADLCTSLGAQVSSSFTSDVTVLVNAGDGSKESTKLKKAKANEKVRVIDEGDFLKMVNTA